jgi:polar amino acid transport system substrate-binding protein
MFDSFYNNLIAEDRYRMILDGLQVTLIITFCAAILGTILGGLVCWMRMSRRKWLQKVAQVYIDIMRGTPVLVVLMLMYYVIMAPMEATGVVVAIITFGLNTAAYIGEMLRTTIQGIDRGQTEAGLALGYTPRQTFLRIILPQVIKAVMPVYQGEIISLLKGTSIVGYIAVADMTRASDLIRSRTFDAFFPIILTAIIYFFMAWLIGRLLTSLVKGERLRALAAAAMLLIGGTICYLPEAFSSEKNAQVSDDVPAIFHALEGKDVGVVIGSIQDIAVTDMAPKALIQRVSNNTDLVAALESGKVDIIGGESLTLIFNKNLAARMDSVSAGMPSIPIGAIFPMDGTELQQDFNSFLSEIRRDGTYDEIINRWTRADDASSLTVPQQRGNGRTIRVASFPSQPPLNFISNGKPSGIEPDLLTEWANRRGWKLEYLLMDFASQIPAIQTGKADLSVGYISITEERKKQVLFSDGYLESEMILMTRKGELGILTAPSQPPVEQNDGRRKPWNLVIFLILSGGLGLIGIGLYLRWRYITRKAAAFWSYKQPAGEPVIRISHLKKSYGTLDVLIDINADVHQGEVISIIGPSGTGKSTLLRCLNLLDPPTGGMVFIDGQNILAKGYPVHLMRQKMGMVFQSFNLFPHKTVLENVTMAPCQLRHIKPETAREEGLALLRKVGLAEKADVYPDSLSGGQKQRVAIARALAMKPEVILFDEPTSALDPTMVGEVLSVIRQLANDGLTMLIVTHEMKFARDVSTRIFFMYDGYIHEDATPQQIFEAPVHSATKAFIQRIRKEVFEVDGPDYDFLGMESTINAFCYKYGIVSKQETAQHLCKVMLDDVMAAYRPLTVRITHSEQSGVTALDFMVEKMEASPLTEEHKKLLAGQCQQIVEEPTERGFRVKLII